MKATTTTASEVRCQYCGAESTTPHFCAECGKIQPLPPDSDYFEFFGLPRKLRLDEGELEKAFYALSRKFHPDYFMAASPTEQQASTDRSSLLNEAYRTLRDPIRRVQYLLLLEGYKEAEKKAPPDLLEEVFELNMEIEELKAAKKLGDEDEVAEARASLEQAENGLRERLAGIDSTLSAAFEQWDSAGSEETDRKKAALNLFSELMSHRSYIQSLIREIDEEI
jgi:molecular chaperone HscB